MENLKGKVDELSQREKEMGNRKEKIEFESELRKSDIPFTVILEKEMRIFSPRN